MSKLPAARHGRRPAPFFSTGCPFKFDSVHHDIILRGIPSMLCRATKARPPHFLCPQQWCCPGAACWLKRARRRHGLRGAPSAGKSPGAPGRRCGWRLARRCAAPSWGAAPRAPSRGLLPTPAGAPSAAWHAAAARAPPRHGLLGQGRVARGDWGTRGQHRVTNLGPQRPTGRTGRASEGLLVLVAVPATREMRRLAAHRTPGCRRPGWQSLRPAASCERSRARPAVPPGAALHTEEHIGGHLRGTAGTATRSNSTRGIWMAP